MDSIIFLMDCRSSYRKNEIPRRNSGSNADELMQERLTPLKKAIQELGKIEGFNPEQAA